MTSFGDPPAGGDPFDSNSVPTVDPDVQVIGSISAPTVLRSRPWLAVIAAAAVVVLVGGAALAMRSFFATSVAAAEVMPPDTEMFISIDFLQFIEGDARKLNDTIIWMIEASGEVATEDLQDVDGLIGELDRAMQDALNVDFSTDIRPWIGRTVSLSVTGIEGLTDYNGLPEILLVIESRDAAAADLFLQEFADGLSVSTGVRVASEEYAGQALFVAEDDFEFDPPLVFGRIDSVVVFGTREAVTSAIDTEPGSSLADDERFAAVMEQLPSDRVMSMYVDANAFAGTLEAEGMTSDLVSDYGTDGVGASLSITDFGIRADSVVLGEDPTGGIDLDAGSIINDLPVDTLAMFGGWSIASLWEAIAATLGGYETEDLLAEAEAEFGVDLDEFLSLLDGPSAIALVRANGGMMATETGYPIGLEVLLGTSAPADVEGYVDQLVGDLSEGGVEDLRKRQLDSGSFWVAEIDGIEAAVIGVAGDYLAATSSLGLADGIGFSPGLIDNEQLQSLAEVMEVDPGSVLFYLDTPGLVDVFEAPGEIASALAPLGAMAASYEVGPSHARGVFVWLIDYVDSE